MPFDGETLEGEIVEDSPFIKVTVIYNPMEPSDRDTFEVDWCAGKTLVEYMGDFDSDLHWVMVTREGVIEKDGWGSYSPELEEPIVLMLSPTKAIGMILVMVALLAVAIWQPEIGLALSSSLGMFSATTWGILAVAFVGVLGSAIMMALGPKVNPNANQNSTDSPSYSLSGASNTSAESIPVPYLYGEFWTGGNKVNFNVESSPDGLNQVGFFQYVVSEGEIDSFEEFMINGQPAYYFFDVSIETRTGTLTQTPFNWFSNQIESYANGATISNVDLITYDTHTTVDRFRIDVQFPQGLYSFDQSSGKMNRQTVPLIIQYAPYGTADFTVLQPGFGWVTIDPTDTYTPVNCSGLRITVQMTGDSSSPQTAYSASGIITNRTGVQELVVQNGAWRELMYDGYGAPVSVGLDPANTNLDVFSDSGVIQNQLTFDPSGGPSYSPGTLTKTFEIVNIPFASWIIGVTGCTLIGVEVLTNSNNVTISAQNRNQLNYSIFSPPLATGRYTIRVSRGTPQASLSQPYLSDQCILSSISEIQSDPVAYIGAATYAVRMQVSNQLSSQPNITAKVKGRKVNIYDRYGNVTDFRWSNNPADVALDILLNWRNRFQIATSRIDFASFDRMRQNCNANNFTFNGIFDFDTTMWDAIAYVMRTGYANLVMSGTKWSVILDAPSDAVMMFTMNNIIKDSFSSFWVGNGNRYNSIEVQYYDKLDYNKQHSQFAFDYENISAGYALRSTTINAVGVVDSQIAADYAQLILNKNKLLQQGVAFDAPIESIGCIVGDVVYIQHDMPQWGYSAIVNAVNVDGTFTIDSDVPFDGSSNWRILVIKGLVTIGLYAIYQVSGSQIRFNGFSAVTGATRVGMGSFDYEVLDEVIAGSELIVTLDRAVDGSIAPYSTATFYKNDVMFEGVLAPVLASSGLNSGLLLGDQSSTTSFNITNEDGSLITWEEAVSSGVRTLSITSWVAGATTIAVNDRVMIGQQGKFMKPFWITKIGYKDKHIRAIEAIEYNATVFDGAAAVNTPNYSSLQSAISQVRNLNATYTTSMLQGGAIGYTAVVSWQPPIDDLFVYSGAKVYVANLSTGVFTAVGDVANGVFTFSMSATAGDVIRFKVVAYDQNKLQADITQAPIASVQIGSYARVPAIPADFSYAPGIQMITMTWTIPNKDDFTAGTEIWESQSTNSLTNAVKVWSGNALSYTRNGIQMGSTWYYWLRTYSITGTFSGYIGPFACSPTFALTADIGDAIINTAKFAAGIKPVNLIADITAPGVTGIPNEIYVNEVDSKLYKWVVTGGVGAFQPIVSAPELAGQLTDAQIAALDAAKLTGQITSTQITDGAVSTPKLAAGAVTAATIAAGAVTTSALAVGSSTNMCWNSCLELVADGWNFSSTQAIAGSGPTKGLSGLDPNWRVPGLGSGFMCVAPTLTTSDYMYATYDPNYTDTTPVLGIPVAPGDVIEVSAQLIPLRCVGRVLIEWLNSSGSLISLSYGTRVIITPQPTSGSALYQYSQSWVSGTAPAGAAIARAFIVGQNDGASDVAAILGANPYVFFTQFSIGPGVPNSTSAQPWSPGGVTSISGGMIKSNTLQASAIVAGSITTDKLAANSITAAVIAAGAINATEIAAGAIKAVHLASEEIISQSVQIGNGLINTAHIGDATITTAKIGNLQVGTSNIASGAVSQVSFAQGTMGVSLTIYTDGSPVIIYATANPLTANYNTSPSMYLSRNGTIIVDYSYEVASGPSGGTMPPVFVMYIDYGGYVGNITYYFGNYPSSYLSSEPPSSMVAMVLRR